MTDSPFILTVTAQNFQSAVLEGSFDRPVLVDFWADWCAPCRMLMPLLARLAEEYGGKFILAKLDTEAEPALAAQFGIRSLPTVQLFREGRAIDQFMGALPEGQIRAFLDRHLPRRADALLARARGHLAAGDIEAAAALIEEARAEDPRHDRLALADVQLRLARGDLAAAASALESLPIALAGDPEAAALRGQIRFAGTVAGAPSEPELRTRLETDPRDSAARHQLAAHLAMRGDYEGALEQLLTLMRQDRAFGEDAGRKGMLAIFDLLGGGDLAARYRARMMNVLY